MDTTKLINALFFIFFFYLFLNSIVATASASASEFCSSSVCRRTEPVIRFPFRLPDYQPVSCGYPGFDLSCGAFNQTLIELPNSGKFAVQAVDYANQNIWLNDPQYCLPRRLLELNLSGSPFNGVFFQDFTLFNCTFDYKRYKLDPIGCLSGENYTVFASSSERAIRFLASKCSLVATVAVPVQWEFFQPVTTSDLSDDIRLSWGWPRCRRCEARGGQCGLVSINSSVTECRNIPRHGLPRGARYAIIVGAGFPAFLCLLGFVYFICGRVICCSRWRQRPVMEFSVVGGPQPTTTMLGLDGPTIESYPKTTLGESCRLPTPDHNICSICLSEYMPKETLRSIPECQHCFHAECIDKWLRMNPSCPICRNSPESSPLPQAS
ncbi:UNVERIFIED_CONTAM: putative RING-H2 finger protein ATL21A [Sesamum radiatum]|uniref:RING-type E3 ubiquitin transferase n=1 Tax=Sesamum radiatum TaxID=300843 RepID=A0AAW2NDN9_SESRA